MKNVFSHTLLGPGFRAAVVSVTSYIADFPAHPTKDFEFLYKANKLFKP